MARQAERDRAAAASGDLPLWALPQLWANLAIGLVAIMPLHSAGWLLTDYLPMDCASHREFLEPGFTGRCSPTVLDQYDSHLALLPAAGLPVLALAYAVNVLLPRRRGCRPSPWLRAAALIPVPYALLCCWEAVDHRMA
jgi:hypothetical protein